MHEKYHLAKKKSPFPCNNVEQSLTAIVGGAFLKEKGNLYFLLLIVCNYFAQGQVCFPDDQPWSDMDLNGKQKFKHYNSARQISVTTICILLTSITIHK